ncbi:hypothetical protein C8J57DRAFT_1589774 [Mycena rebaudengoi]|nr:hypothetical protein C8J57DRAFT_1589774 [Mycena rebaudengoi]
MLPPPSASIAPSASGSTMSAPTQTAGSSRVPAGAFFELEPEEEKTPVAAPPHAPAPVIILSAPPAAPEPKGRYQGASVAMTEAIKHMPRAQELILEGFTHPELGKHCQCGQNAPFRCTTCWKGPMYCQSCLVASHHHNPFHMVEEWDATAGHFQGRRLSDLGLVLQTDPLSGAKRCPNAELSTKTTLMTVVNENGFHEMNFEFCSCPDQVTSIVPEVWEQLVAMKLYPASFKKPATVFTQSVLKEFHIHSLASKKSAYDYVKALAKLTNNVFPQSVKDRYREFQLAHRQWRKLALECRTGQAHGIDKHVPHRQPGSLTLRCPGCPEVGYNISEEAMSEALESERHKVTLFLSMDGNFKLQRKNKRDDPDDIALNDGHGYFVETMAFEVYVEAAKESEDLGTCSHLRASRMQNISKFKNAVVSGVIAVQCARHGFYMPNGMVDLKKGEGFAFGDYAVAGAVREARYIWWIKLTYDIWCQYQVNFFTRMADYFPDIMYIIFRITGAIPKMHIHNHIARCKVQWNLNWMSFVALTVGEMIETGWAEQNLTAGSTKEQNAGNRHDSIDDTSGHWNWDKTVGFSATLLRLFKICAVERWSRGENFEAVNALHPPELIKSWESMDVERDKDASGKFYSVYEVNFAKGPPTHAAEYEKLLKAELEEKMAHLQMRTGDAGLITEGLLLERDCEHVKRMVALSEDADILRGARRRICNEVSGLRTRQIQRVPALEGLMKAVDTERPEEENLFFPSDFGEEDRTKFQLDGLAEVEYKLREGLAYDSLGDLVLAIQTVNYNLGLKKANIHGTGANTKGQNYLKTLSNEVQIAGDTYRRMREHLVQLGVVQKNPHLKPLNKKQQRGKGGSEQAMGQAKKIDPWFWTVAQPANLTSKELAKWQEELQRVKWFRDRALFRRAMEEEETLQAEFERAIAAFSKSADIWALMADEAKAPGARAYACKHVTMYGRLAAECVKARAQAPAAGLKAIEDEKKKREKEVAAKDGTNDYSNYYETVTVA